MEAKKIANARIDAKGNVIVGDHNIILNLKEAADYVTLEQEIEELEVKIAQLEQSKSVLDMKFEAIGLCT